MRKIFEVKPEIKLIDKFVPEPEAFFVKIRDSVIWDERMKARKTASFGVPYNYSDISYQNTNMPECLVRICEKIKNEIGFFPNNCLMNYYPDGESSMGFHSDNAEGLAKNTGVIIVSLGSIRSIQYRLIKNKDIKVSYVLTPGSLLYMSNGVQVKWQHAIPKEENVGGRISLTFRELEE